MMCLAALGSGACATSGAVPLPFPGAPTASAAPASAPSASTSAPGGASADKPAGKPVAPDEPYELREPHEPNEPKELDLTSRRFDGRAVAEFALGFRGVPYRPGGADPAGFDCSGLVQYVFAQYGIEVPRVVEEQYDVGDKIRPSQIKPGDLLFFNTKRRGRDASHVAIAIGKDSFVHAPNSAGVVRVETLASSYWGTRYIGARRLTGKI